MFKRFSADKTVRAIYYILLGLLWLRFIYNIIDFFEIKNLSESVWFLDAFLPKYSVILFAIFASLLIRIRLEKKDV